MKKYIIIYIAMLAGSVSCKKSWLEIVPQGSQVAVTTDDYDKLMNDPGLYFSAYQGGAQEAMLMGDEVAAETPFFANRSITRDRLFQWQDSIYPSVDQTSSTLHTHLAQLYQFNKVINEVMTAQGGTVDKKNAIRAEALASRAWSNFNMAGYYCKPYVASTASTDPGFPVTTEADVTLTNYPRGTVQQTYDFIIKDLTDALVSIPVKQNIVTRVSKPAVEGLLGKVYLFMGRYSDALPLLNAALADVTANGQTSLYNYNQTLAPGGSFLPIDQFTGPNSPGQNFTDLREAVLSKVFNGGSMPQISNAGLVLTPQAAALYGASDLRRLFYTDKNPDNSVNAGGRLRKYGVTYMRWGLQLSELYLLCAEAKARTNDLSGAVTDVETLRKNRMPVADAAVPAGIAGNQTALVKFIIDERIREFAMEGFRWFDMRRLSVDPLFTGITFTHTLYNADGSTTVYTLQQPNRLVLKLPRDITDSNPDMTNNP